MKKTLSRNFKVGAMVVVAVFLLFFGLNYLKGSDIFTADSFYYVHFDRVDGVQKSIPVNIKGFKVGQVMDIRYEPQNRHPFTLVLAISKKTKIPLSSRIELYDDGLLGTKGLRVVMDEREIASGKLFHSGDTLPSFTSGGLMARVENELLEKINSIALRADSLLASLNLLAGNGSLQNTLNSLETASASLAATSVRLNAVMNNEVPVLLGNVTTMTDDLKLFSSNVKTIDLAATVDSLDATVASMKSIAEKINAGDGSLGALMNDRALYQNLQNAADNANRLLIDLKENPKRYVHFSIW